jgi:hypothetical protein
MKLFGFGSTALRLVDIYADEFERISGTVRHAEKRDELRRQKLDAYLFGAVEHSEIASRIKEADVVCTENLCAGVVVVKPAQDGVCFDASDSLNFTSDRCIFVQ